MLKDKTSKTWAQWSEDIQMSNKQMKCLTSLVIWVIRKMQIKTIITYWSTRSAKMKETVIVFALNGLWSILTMIYMKSPIWLIFNVSNWFLTFNSFPNVISQFDSQEIKSKVSVQCTILQKTLLTCFKKVRACVFSCVQLFVPRTIVHQEYENSKDLGKENWSKFLAHEQISSPHPINNSCVR